MTIYELIGRSVCIAAAWGGTVNNKPENPHAFAFAHSNFNDEWVTSQGMTLRDYFAAKAMQGWLASYGPDTPHPASASEHAAKQVAAQAYALADAMLAAREK